jgi:hypothetical protein
VGTLWRRLDRCARPGLGGGGTGGTTARGSAQRAHRSLYLA